jgi:hypothetical protein
MYDHVDAPPITCPKCGKKISGWQSKDAGCDLDTVSIKDVREFYSSCPCGIWAQYNLKRPVSVTMDDFVLNTYDMTTTEPKKETP